MRGPGDLCSCSPCPHPPPDVDECAWDTGLCPEGQRCVDLVGSYRCLPDCGPGFREATEGAGCEGDGDGVGLSGAQQRGRCVSLGRRAFGETGTLLAEGAQGSQGGA